MERKSPALVSRVEGVPLGKGCAKVTKESQGDEGFQIQLNTANSRNSVGKSTKLISWESQVQALPGVRDNRISVLVYIDYFIVCRLGLGKALREKSQ